MKKRREMYAVAEFTELQPLCGFNEHNVTIRCEVWIGIAHIVSKSNCRSHYSNRSMLTMIFPEHILFHSCADWCRLLHSVDAVVLVVVAVTVTVDIASIDFVASAQMHFRSMLRYNYRHDIVSLLHRISSWIDCWIDSDEIRYDV